MRNEGPGNQLIRVSFIRMLFLNMFVLMTMSICGFVDSLVISRRLGPEALGFFSPAAQGIGMFNMVVMGSQILIGNYIGAGKKDRMVGLFAFLFVPVFGINAAWLGNAVVDLACLGVILASVWIWKGDFSLHTDDLLKLPDDFGAAPDKLFECALRSRDKVCESSESAVRSARREASTCVRLFSPACALKKWHETSFSMAGIRKRTSMWTSA